MSNERDNAILGQKVKLQVQYFDVNGEAVDPDETPTVRIVDNDGNEVLDFTDDDVYKQKAGLYQIEYEVPSDSEVGMWTDTWRSIFGGQNLDTTFVFTVVNAETGIEPTTGPGKIKLGDDVIFDFSDEEIYGINVMLKFLKARLNSTGTKPMRDQFGAFVRDGYGEVMTEVCNVFTDDALIGFLCMSLSEFNMTPFFTAYTFADKTIQSLFIQIIVEGASVYAMAAQSLLEKGRDFTISDGGISYQPPALGDFLMSTYGTWLTSYRERLKFIKNSIRPGPIGIGTFSSMTGGSPAVNRLRHLRARRII